ncbi:hypothetical protein [Lacinutrix undariae]
MRLFALFICSCLFFVACGNSEKETPTPKKKKIVYDMYEPSEMAILMNKMYDYNLQLKKDVLEGKELTKFPIDFMKIHSAQLTQEKHRDEGFESFSKLFIAAEKEIFNTDSPLNIDERFNTMVNLCVACHQTRCTGPIPRIKKLLIK